MGDWISLNKLVPKLPSPMSFLKSWRFLMRQISKSVAKSTPAFEERETSRFPTTWKSSPKIKGLEHPLWNDCFHTSGLVQLGHLLLF